MNALTAIQTTSRILGRVAPRVTARAARKLLMTPHPHRMRAHEHPALASGAPITFRFGGTGLRWGTRGPVVLAMHGWEGRPTQFSEFIAPLLAAGRQVVAIEAPGHGRTASDGESSVLRFTEALLEAAAELREVESVLGHSMGGAAALYAVSQGLPATRGVTIGSPAALSRVLARFADAIALPPAARREFFAVVDAHVGIRAADVDVERLAPALGIETLIVHDQDDREVPFVEAAHWVAALPAARLLATEGLGHSRILADAGVVDQVSRFLTA